MFENVSRKVFKDSGEVGWCWSVVALLQETFAERYSRTEARETSEVKLNPNLHLASFRMASWRQ
jgi:hypothetical protein